MDISPTPYKVLSGGLFSKIQSLGYNVTEEEANEIVFDYIRPASVKFKACKKKLSDRDELLQTFNIELNDEEIEILCNLILVEWLSANYINVPMLLKQSMPSKDFQVFSKRNHLDGLVNLREIYKQETRQMISAYSNGDSDLFEKLKAKKNQSQGTESTEQIET